MTAASEARDQLEAVVHAQLTRAWKYGLDAPARTRPGHSPTPAEAILAATDAYAEAAASAEVSRIISDPVLLIKRQRLLAATAERTGRIG